MRLRLKNVEVHKGDFIHFLNDAGAPESGDELSRGGHGEVPL